MKKKMLLLALSAIFIFPNVVNAADISLTQDKFDEYENNSYINLVDGKYILSEGSYELGEDINVSDIVFNTGTINALDLNGHSLNGNININATDMNTKVTISGDENSHAKNIIIKGNFDYQPEVFVLGGNYNYVNTEKSTLLVKDSVIENDPDLINESTGQTGILISSSGVLTLENTTVKGGLRGIYVGSITDNSINLTINGGLIQGLHATEGVGIFALYRTLYNFKMADCTIKGEDTPIEIYYELSDPTIDVFNGFLAEGYKYSPTITMNVEDLTLDHVLTIAEKSIKVVKDVEDEETPTETPTSTNSTQEVTTKNPKTSDNLVTYLLILGISLSVLVIKRD